MKKQVIAVILLVIAALCFADTNSSAKNQEDIESQYAAGLVSLIRCDYEEAFKCFKRLAEQGHAGAQYNLGRRYYLGEGTSVDMKQAACWIKKAYENGFENAKFFWEAKELWRYEERSCIFYSCGLIPAVPANALRRGCLLKYGTLFPRFKNILTGLIKKIRVII